MDGKIISGIMMCKLKGRADGWKRGALGKLKGHYDVEMKGWMEKVAL